MSQFTYDYAILGERTKQDHFLCSLAYQLEHALTLEGKRTIDCMNGDTTRNFIDIVALSQRFIVIVTENLEATMMDYHDIMMARSLCHQFSGRDMIVLFDDDIMQHGKRSSWSMGIQMAILGDTIQEVTRCLRTVQQLSVRSVAVAPYTLPICGHCFTPLHASDGYDFCDECGMSNKGRSPQTVFSTQPALSSPTVTHVNMIECVTCHALSPMGASSCTSCHYSTLGARIILIDAAQAITQRMPAQKLLHERYRLIGTPITGGFGEVWKAEDTRLQNRSMAVKKLLSGTMKGTELAEAIADFQHEAHLLAALMHPNLPRIYDSFEEGGHHYLVMDYIEGMTLEEHVADVKTSLPFPVIRAIAEQLCDVLEYLHSRHPQIIFRDLKPSNIMLTLDGHVYLIDFGIARHFNPMKAKDTKSLGSPGYCPPEQYGRAQTTPASDIYSLGAVLHFLATLIDPSDNPFQFDPIAGHAEWSEFVLSLVVMKQQDRPQTITEVRAKLETVRDEPPQSQIDVFVNSWIGAQQLSLPTPRQFRNTVKQPVVSGKALRMLVINDLLDQADVTHFFLECQQLAKQVGCVWNITLPFPSSLTSGKWQEDMLLGIDTHDVVIVCVSPALFHRPLTSHGMKYAIRGQDVTFYDVANRLLTSRLVVQSGKFFVFPLQYAKTHYGTWTSLVAENPITVGDHWISNVTPRGTLYLDTKMQLVERVQEKFV